MNKIIELIQSQNLKYNKIDKNCFKSSRDALVIGMRFLEKVVDFFS